MCLNFDSTDRYKGKVNFIEVREKESSKAMKGFQFGQKRNFKKTNLIGKSYHFNFCKKKQNTSASLTSRNTVLKIEDMIREKLKFHGKLI